MNRRSWLWRRKSFEKSPGETESSGSVSSHSERLSDDQVYWFYCWCLFVDTGYWHFCWTFVFVWNLKMFMKKYTIKRINYFQLVIVLTIWMIRIIFACLIFPNPSAFRWLYQMLFLQHLLSLSVSIILSVDLQCELLRIFLLQRCRWVVGCNTEVLFVEINFAVSFLKNFYAATKMKCAEILKWGFLPCKFRSAASYHI